MSAVVLAFAPIGQRNLAPVGTFRIGIQHPQVCDGVLSVREA
jgi:hypothetical protein